MFLLYDTSLADDWPYLLLILGVIIGLVFYYRHSVRQQRELEVEQHDAYSHAVNDSNYNINREGIDGHRDDIESPAEAHCAVENLKATDQVPSREEFQSAKEELDDRTDLR